MYTSDVDIGLADRLWIQRAPPGLADKVRNRKTVSPVRKRKTKVPRRNLSTRLTSGDSIAPSSQTTKSMTTSQLRIKETDVSVQSSAKRHCRAQNQAMLDSMHEESNYNGNSRVRAAKTKANARLDIQAKQLAAAKAEIEALNRRALRRSYPQKDKILGTRKSRRLNTNDSDDEWQQVPEEWLVNDSDVNTLPMCKAKSSGRGGRSNKSAFTQPASPLTLDSDSSELTELSDVDLLGDDESERVHVEGYVTGNGADTAHQMNGLLVSDLKDFIEWETVCKQTSGERIEILTCLQICVSLLEWENVAVSLLNATHYSERALYKRLTGEIVPSVTVMLRVSGFNSVFANAFDTSLKEMEKHRSKEEALLNRKRSSRIAIREFERETSRLVAQKQAEDEERLARLRRAEARARKEEEERANREKERERRRLEREQRELVRNKRAEDIE